MDKNARIQLWLGISLILVLLGIGFIVISKSKTLKFSDYAEMDKNGIQFNCESFTSLRYTEYYGKYTYNAFKTIRDSKYEFKQCKAEFAEYMIQKCIEIEGEGIKRLIRDKWSSWGGVEPKQCSSQAKESLLESKINSPQIERDSNVPELLRLPLYKTVINPILITAIEEPYTTGNRLLYVVKIAISDASYFLYYLDNKSALQDYLFILKEMAGKD